MTYQMHRPGFDRQRACRGHFNDVEIPTVDSDDGVDYIDWETREENGWPRDVEYTYRIIDGEKIRFRDGVAYSAVGR
jgi:hypothetical protein